MRRLLRGIGLVAGALMLGILQVAVLALGPLTRPWRHVLPQRFHRLCCALMGLRLHVVGTCSTADQTLWVANHQSYLDICVLGAVLPGRFVAKHEVRGWPVLGWLSRLQGTVFIGRRTTDAGQALGTMANALEAGANLIVFPEGTTSGGRGVLPFRSTPFAVLLRPSDCGRMIQPVTIRIGCVGDVLHEAPYAYHGDDVLLPHLARFMTRKRTEVHVLLHASTPTAAFAGDRKRAATRLRDVVASGFTPSA